MTNSEIKAIIEAITYKPGWTLHLSADDAALSRPFLQLNVSIESDASLDSAARDGTRTPWKSGKRYLSYFMCRQEIVGAVFGMIKDAESHEMREWFRYRGASIYNPHLDPDALVPIARKRASFNVRGNAMTMEES